MRYEDRRGGTWSSLAEAVEHADAPTIWTDGGEPVAHYIAGRWVIDQAAVARATDREWWAGLPDDVRTELTVRRITGAITVHIGDLLAAVNSLTGVTPRPVLPQPSALLGGRVRPSGDSRWAADLGGGQRVIGVYRQVADARRAVAVAVEHARDAAADALAAAAGPFRLLAGTRHRWVPAPRVVEHVTAGRPLLDVARLLDVDGVAERAGVDRAVVAANADRLGEPVARIAGEPVWADWQAADYRATASGAAGSAAPGG